MKRQIVILIISLAMSGAAFAKKAHESDASEFAKIESDARKFEHNKKAQKLRHNFEKLAERWENFAQKHPKSKKALDAHLNAAALYEKVATISGYEPDFEKAAKNLISAAKLKTKAADQDALAMKAMKIYVSKLSDQDAAAEVIGPFLKKFATKKHKLPNIQGWYAEYQEQKRVVEKLAKAKAAKVEKKAEAAKPEATKPPEEPQFAKIANIEITKNAKGVGLLISASGSVRIKQGVLEKNENAGRRVFFDIEPAQIMPGTKSIFDVDTLGIKQVRMAQNDNDTVRIVAQSDDPLPVTVKGDGTPLSIWFGELPAAETSKPEIATQKEPPPKLAEAQEPAKASEPTKAPEPSKAPEPTPSASEIAKVIPDLVKKIDEKTKSKERTPFGLSIRKIVIDAGHGGHDPGAIGKGGLKEKDVTLAIAKKLKASLEEQLPGVHVFMTRDTDKYLALGERTEIANNLDADLFISVHVNSSLNRKTQGIETYYLNISHDRYAVRLAARENAMSETEISNLEFILADLAMKSNVSDSVRLGREVQTSTHNHVQGTWNDVKDLGLKHALFYVLLGARMPAILVETSFISNRTDEKRLRTDKYQDAIVAGITNGVVRYSEQKQAMYRP